MKRREFIAASAALLVSPRVLRAQGTPRRIGCFGILENAPIILDAWRSGLRERSWIEGKNLLVEYRYTQPTDRYPALAAELTALSPDLVVASRATSSRRPEIGNRYHSDCIRGCGRSRGNRPRPKSRAPRRQHNGLCDLGARRLELKRSRNPPGTGSRRLENCALGQSGQPNTQADVGRGDTPHSPEPGRGSAGS